jgi:hypothetical protein
MNVLAELHVTPGPSGCGPQFLESRLHTHPPNNYFKMQKNGAVLLFGIFQGTGAASSQKLFVLMLTRN